LYILFANFWSQGTEKEEAIQKRMRNALQEMSFADEPDFFEHVLVNSDIDQAYEELKAVLIV
jgi:guanylate kinase